MEEKAKRAARGTDLKRGEKLGRKDKRSGRGLASMELSFDPASCPGPPCASWEKAHSTQQEEENWPCVSEEK